MVCMGDRASSRTTTGLYGGQGCLKRGGGGVSTDKASNLGNELILDNTHHGGSLEV